MSQEFWLGFFERKASSRRKISSLSLNGFRDFQQARRIRLSVLNIIQSVRPSAVVDCGCGDGSVAMLISQYCKSVLGVEISPSMCEIAKKKHSNIVNSSMHSFLDSNSNAFDNANAAVSSISGFGGTVVSLWNIKPG